MIIVRRIVPADNNCLFNSVAYALEKKSKTKALALRKSIADFITKNIDQYKNYL